MQTRDEIEDRIVDAALDLAAEHGWRELSLAGAARRAGLPLLQVYRCVPAKADLPAVVIASVDRAMLADGPADSTDSPRDRLFDVMMRRLDALQARRAGTIALIHGLRAEPRRLPPLLPRLARSLGRVLDAAGLPSAGPVRALRIEALAVVWANTLRVWLEDDTSDMARTMASLDRDLARLERAARFLPVVSARRERGAAEAPGARASMRR